MLMEAEQLRMENMPGQGIRSFDAVTDEARAYFDENGIICIANFLSAEELTALRHIHTEALRFRKGFRYSAAQRFQPLRRFEPLKACLQHVDVNKVAAIATRLLNVEAFVIEDLLGAWISNSRLTYVLPWHRDIRDNSFGYDYRLWEAKQPDREYFLQFNLPIFDDSSFWVVPGSAARRDTETEAAMFAKKPVQVPGQERFLNPWLPKNRVYTNGYRLKEYLLNGMDKANRISAGINKTRLAGCRSYVETMPNAVEVHVKAGDILFYRGCAWHTAIYRADVQRFTFFSNVRTQRSDQWYQSEFLPSHEKYVAKA